MSFQAGDTIIHSAMLAGDGGAADITQHLRHFSVYESLKKPYVALQAQVLDMVDIASRLNGTNYLQLSFGQPGQDPYEKTFVITSVQRSHNARNLREQELEIVGYSPHMTSFPKIQKAYKNMTATDVVQDLVQTFLKPLLVPFSIEAPSRGQVGNDRMPYNLNGVQLHKAIRQTLLRAVSTTDESSAYVMFENNKKLIVDTLVNLQGKVNPGGDDRSYIQRPMGANWMRDVALQNRIILTLEEESRIDKTQVVQADAIQTRPYDVFANKFSTIGLGTQPFATYMNIPYNILRPPTFLAGALPERKRAAAAYDQQSLTIHVALNPRVTVGEGFAAQTLKPGSSTNVEPAVVDNKLLCTECRHTVNLTKTRMVGTTTAKGVLGDMSIF